MAPEGLGRHPEDPVVTWAAWQINRWRARRSIHRASLALTEHDTPANRIGLQLAELYARQVDYGRPR